MHIEKPKQIVIWDEGIQLQICFDFSKFIIVCMHVDIMYI
jgi:hypothetical protein